MRKFRTKEGLKAKKSPISLKRILNLVRRFKETGNFEDRRRSGRPALRANRAHVVQSVIEDLTAETSTGSSSAHEVERRMGIPEPLIRRILHGMLDLYPY